VIAEAEPRSGTILVVEDDAELRATIVDLLRREVPRAEVLAAADGDEAWDRLQRRGVDVLLSDVVMPGLDGLELARRVRATPATAATQVILITGAASPAALLAAAEEGADDCLLKPVRREELAVRVRAALRRVADLERLRARARELEVLNERQSDFLSVVSHEIRTPLSAILSSANILMRYGAARPDSVERFARVIHQEGQRLTRLINNLLDLAKIEAGLVEWRADTVAVDALLDRVRDSFAALAGERRVRLELDRAADATEVHGDGDKLTQVLLNLVSNAVKHSPDDAAVRVRVRGRDGGGVRFEVEDDGPGIPPGLEERVFERFAQLESGEERGGTGLGLTICKQIVEHHGGRIWAEPERGAGARFIAELPRHAAFEATDGPV
jgi:signal transduction histidine kinase